MSNLKKLGISLRVVKNEKYDEKRDMLSHDWPILLEKLDFLPIYIPNTLDNIENFLDESNINCILLSGGDNIGEYPERDNSEKQIIDYAIKNEIPIFGVCRGMQILNDYFHGKIEKTNSLNHVRKNHDVKIVNEFLKKYLKNERINVNSFHQNIIKNNDLSDELKPFAIFEDDQTVEGFVHEKLPIMGVMWHPERNSNEKNQEILKQFLSNEEFRKNII